MARAIVSFLLVAAVLVPSVGLAQPTEYRMYLNVHNVLPSGCNDPSSRAEYVVKLFLDGTKALETSPTSGDLPLDRLRVETISTTNAPHAVRIEVWEYDGSSFFDADDRCDVAPGEPTDYTVDFTPGGKVAISSVGNTEVSAQLSAFLTDSVAFPAGPPAPVTLTVSKTSDTAYRLSWTRASASASFDSYGAYSRAGDSLREHAKIQDVDVLTTEATGLVATTAYEFMVVLRVDGWKIRSDWIPGSPCTSGCEDPGESGGGTPGEGYAIHFNVHEVVAQGCSDPLDAPELFYKIYADGKPVAESAPVSTTRLLVYKVEELALERGDHVIRFEVWDKDSGFLGDPDDACDVSPDPTTFHLDLPTTPGVSEIHESAGDNASSARAEFYLADSDGASPPAPPTVAVEDVTAQGANLMWTAEDAVDFVKYQVLGGIAGAPRTLAEITDPSTREHALSDLKDNATHEVRVIVHAGEGFAVQSTPTSFQTPICASDCLEEEAEPADGAGDFDDGYTLFVNVHSIDYVLTPQSGNRTNCVDFFNPPDFYYRVVLDGKTVAGPSRIVDDASHAEHYSTAEIRAPRGPHTLEIEAWDADFVWWFDGDDGCDVSPGAGYSLRVDTHPGILERVDSTGVGNGSARLVAVVSDSDSRVPPSPVTLSASDVGERTATLSWTASDDAEFQKYVIVGARTQEIGSLDETTWSFDDLVANATYEFRVRVMTADGFGATSAPVRFKTDPCSACPPKDDLPPPSALTYRVHGDELEFFWDRYLEPVDAISIHVSQTPGFAAAYFPPEANWIYLTQEGATIRAKGKLSELPFADFYAKLAVSKGEKITEGPEVHVVTEYAPNPPPSWNAEAANPRASSDEGDLQASAPDTKRAGASGAEEEADTDAAARDTQDAPAAEDDADPSVQAEDAATPALAPALLVASVVALAGLRRRRAV